MAGGAFLSRSVSQPTDRSDWFRMFARQSNIFVITHGRVSRDWKIISTKQNQNIKEALTGTSLILNILRENRVIVLKPKQEMVIYSPH